MQRPVVLYDATEHHPAQTQLISEDVTIGHWETTYRSGALPVPRKEALLEKIDAVRNAVKRARSRANDQEVARREVGAALLSYIFG